MFDILQSDRTTRWKFQESNDKDMSFPLFAAHQCLMHDCKESNSLSVLLSLTCWQVNTPFPTSSSHLHSLEMMNAMQQLHAVIRSQISRQLTSAWTSISPSPLGQKRKRINRTTRRAQKNHPRRPESTFTSIHAKI